MYIKALKIEEFSLLGIKSRFLTHVRDGVVGEVVKSAEGGGGQPHQGLINLSGKCKGKFLKNVR